MNADIVEIWHRCQADIADLKDGQGTANVRLAEIEQQLAGLHLTVGAHSAELTALKARIELIERRLEPEP